MSRYIDADALRKQVINKCEVWDRWILDEIDNAPTVEERPNGKWIEKEDYVGDTYYDCSNCGNSWSTLEGTPWQNGMSFCPNCGAYMEK